MSWLECPCPGLKPPLYIYRHISIERKKGQEMCPLEICYWEIIRFRTNIA